MPPESDDDRLLLDRKDGRFDFLGACREIGGGLALLPLRDSLLVDPVALSVTLYEIRRLASVTLRGSLFF